MYRRHAATFLSGRLVALVVLFAFQIVVVRVLAPKEYAIYSLFFAFSSLMQATASFGIPRVIAKYVSQAGVLLSHNTVRRVCAGLLLVRLVGSLICIGVPVVAIEVFAPHLLGDLGMVAVGAGFILATSFQFDTDAMSQALMLQTASRRVAIGEPAIRLALICAQAWVFGLHSAVGVLTISLATSATAALTLGIGVLRKLATVEDHVDVLPSVDVRELVSIGLGGYASTMAWFASSPAIVRMIAGKLVTVTIFAGFGFCQSLVLSFQRYSPGFILFPFVEPMVMKDLAQTKSPVKLRNALSLVIKIDIIVMGAAIVGSAIAGKPIVDLITGHKYGAEAYVIPWLLAYIASSSVYRSFEISAIALGAASVFRGSLFISLGWLALMVVLGLKFGLIALLLCPLGDGVSRLVFIGWVLSKAGIRNIVDLPAISTLVAGVAVIAALGWFAADRFHIESVSRVALGAGLSGLFLCLAFLSRPLREGEVSLVSGRGGRMFKLVQYGVRS